MPGMSCAAASPALRGLERQPRWQRGVWLMDCARWEPGRKAARVGHTSLRQNRMERSVRHIPNRSDRSGFLQSCAANTGVIGDEPPIGSGFWGRATGLQSSKGITGQGAGSLWLPVSRGVVGRPDAPRRKFSRELTDSRFVCFRCGWFPVMLPMNGRRDHVSLLQCNPRSLRASNATCPLSGSGMSRCPRFYRITQPSWLSRRQTRLRPPRGKSGPNDRSQRR